MIDDDDVQFGCGISFFFLIIYFFTWARVTFDPSDAVISIKGAIITCIVAYVIHISLFFVVGHPFRKFAILMFLVGLVGVTAKYSYDELTLSPDERVARAEQQFQLEKEELEEAHRQEIKEAQAQVKLAEIEAKRLALYNDSTKNEEQTQEIERAKAKLKTIKAQGVNYSKLSQPRESGGPVDNQRRLVLSGLWLGACFFLQRVFEKLFKDKGYALLTVCAAGFLLAFFTANYFLLGGSVTGGLMGAAGDRT